MEIIYNHYLGENISRFIQNEILPKLDTVKCNEEFEEDEVEGLVDIVECIEEGDFEGGKELILKYVMSLGYEEDDDSWKDEVHLNFFYTIEWDESIIRIKYNSIIFNLLSDDKTRKEWDIPTNFNYYVENIFSSEGFVFKEKINH